MLPVDDDVCIGISQTQNKKRTHEEDKLARGNHKMAKIEHKGGIFSENDIPDGTFHIGESTFVYASTFRGNVSVHIRRFTKYGATFYPSKEGVTLHPRWVECIMKPGRSPKTPRDLRDCCCPLPKKLVTIDSADFEHFIFRRYKTTQKGDIIENSITLSSAQWTEMKQQYNSIASSVLDHMYDAMDFYAEYKTLCEEENGSVNEDLPVSLDATLGIQVLQQIAGEALAHCLRDRGMMNPVILTEELCANKIETFNSAAFSVDVSELVSVFYSKVGEDRNFLCLSKPARYVSPRFFRNLKLRTVLHEVREFFCPTNGCEFFEDYEVNSM